MAGTLTIARTEFRRLRRQRSYWLLLAAFTALALLAAGLSRHRALREQAQQADYQRLVRAQWEGQPDRHPHRVAHYGTFAFKPAGPLAAFDPGVEPYAGRIQFLEAHRQNAANFSEAGALSSAFRLGELSLAFLLQCGLPLALIVLGHRLLAGEIESGRLRLLMTQGASSRRLLAGKLGGLALGAVPFLAATGLATVAATAGGLHGLGGPWLARLGTLGGAAALYAAGWVALTLWISARSRTAGQALALLVGLWVAFCVILPRSVAALATAAYPTPSKSAFTERLAAEVYRLGDSHNAADPNFQSIRDRLLTQYGVTKVEDLPFNYGAAVMMEGEELSAEVFARHLGELEQIHRQQNRLLALSSALNPALGFRVVSAAISGTDYAGQARFLREAEAYRYEFVQGLNTLHRDKVRYVGDRDQRLDHTHWAEFPDFQPTVPGLGESLRGAAIGWAALALWLVGPLCALLRLKLSPA